MCARFHEIVLHKIRLTDDQALDMLLLIGVGPYQRQWLVGLSLSLGTMTAGTLGGWTSPYIARLTAPDCTHPLKLTSSEASWVVSVSGLGMIIGAALGATVQDFIGRKKMLLYSSGPMAIGWGLIIIAPTVSWLYASLILCGFAKGMLVSGATLFIGEIADPMIRGSLIILLINALSVGTLLGTIMGGFLPLEMFSYVCIVTTGLFMVSFSFVPESPYYHVANGDLKKAEKSLKWYRKDVDVKQEMRELQDFIGSTSVSVTKRFHEFKKPQHRKNLFIILCITVFLFCAGESSVNGYTEIILRNSQVDVKPSFIVMGLAYSAIVAGTVALVLVDKFGRKTMLVASGLGLCVGHILLGSHFHMLSSGIEPKSISWLPVLSLFLVYFSIPCGLGTAPDTLVSELFPPILKAPVSFTFFGISALLTFGVSKSFQPYLDLVGEKYVFWTFATSAFCSVVFSYFCVPETARIPLIVIQKNLKKDGNETHVAAVDVETDVRVHI